MSVRPTSRGQNSEALLAGVISAVVGFSSSFAVVLAGLTAVGASPAEAGSGVAILCLTMGLGCVLFSWRFRVPVTMAWSTPGAALLATTAAPAGGFATAVGAFVITGVLILLTGLFRQLAVLVGKIPTSIASAMLAGVLLPLCVAPFLSLAQTPLVIGPLVLTWLVMLRLAPRWAVPGALAAAIAVMAFSGTFGALDLASLQPRLTWTTPAFSWDVAVAIALPLYVVTMTSQNIPGVTVLASFGYPAPMRSALVYTGATTALGAPAGGHAINLAAISAALAAGPEAGPDPARRWIAGVACGVVYMLLGPLSSAVAAASDAAPPGLLAAVAGLALIATFASSAGSALASEDIRVPAAVTFLVAASGVVVVGIGAAFWSLIAGLVVHQVIKASRPSA